MSENPLLELALTVALLSLVAIGGLNAVLPEIQQQVVAERGWLTDDELADLVAIAQAAPGPNGLVISLVGWRVAGLAGFGVATVAMAVPPALLAFGLSRLHRRLAAARWLRSVQAGLLPITIGLILASGLVMARAAGDSPAAIATTAVTALVVWRTRLSPLWPLGAGALVGLAGA